MTDTNNQITLEPHEQAVLRAIISQLSESVSNIFVYDFFKAQKFLHKIGAFTKYNLTAMRQFEIIEDLTNKGIISTDCIYDIEFTNKCRAATNPNLPRIESEQRYFWIHNTSWAYESLQLNGLLTIEQAYKLGGGSLHIRMTPEEANFIEENYLSSRIVYLKVDKTNTCLSVKFGQNDKWHNQPRLDETKAPYKILLAAYELDGHPLTTIAINKKIANIGNKSLKSQVFSDNGAVQKLAPLLIDLRPKSITFKKSSRITPNQEQALKKALKII